MPGPAPKPKDQRINRVKPSRGEWVELERRTEPAPESPLADEFADDWASLWSSPMATMWQDEDVAVVARVLMLRVAAIEALDTKLMSELRQLEDRLGLNPKGRRDLRWIIPDTEPADPRVGKVGDEVSRRRQEREARLANSG